MRPKGDLRHIEIRITLALGDERTTVEMSRTFLSADPPKDFREWARRAVERAEGDIEQSQSQHGEQS